MNYFENVIGQQGLKRKLGFYLDAYQTTSKIPFILFSGAKGLGKSMMMREMARHLTNRDGSKRPLLELNCSVIKNNTTFFENIFLTYINNNKITVAFDEFHNCPNDLAQALLTICNTSTEAVREFRWQDSNFVFDFTKISFLFSTTETDKIFAPLKDRFDIIDLEAYSTKELIDILKLNCDEIIFNDGSEKLLGGILRGNARSAVKVAELVNTYCVRFDKDTFDEKDFFELCKLTNILPYGIMSNELSILRELNARGSCSLQMLASATGLSRTTIQKDIEGFMLKNGYMRIDGQRKITTFGQKVLKECQEFFDKVNGVTAAA